MQQITNNLNEIEEASANFLDQYADIKFLWEEELEVSFQKFLSEGPDLRETFIERLHKVEEGVELEEEQIEEEIESFDAMSTKILDGVTTRQPSLEMFDEKISQLHEVKARIADMKPSSDIGWLRVNSQPLINSLKQIVNQWIERFTSFLLNNTTTQLKNINSFLTEVSEGIKELPPAALSAEKDKDKINLN